MSIVQIKKSTEISELLVFLAEISFRVNMKNRFSLFQFFLMYGNRYHSLNLFLFFFVCKYLNIRKIIVFVPAVVHNCSFHLTAHQWSFFSFFSVLLLKG